MSASSPTRPDGIPWDQIEGDGPDLASAVVDLIEWLVDQDRERILDNRTLERLYAGYWVTSDDLMMAVSAYSSAGGDPVKLNFAKNAVDFVHMKVTKEVPAVVATAKGGGYAQGRRAEQLTKYLDKVTEGADLEELAKSAAKHALRTGTAFIKTHGDGGKPGLELVPADWVFMDRVEARSGTPRSIYERRPVTLRYLLERFGDDEDAEQAIRNAPPPQDPLGLGTVDETSVDMRAVYEAWTLPEGETPGRHVICVQGMVLLEEEWTVPRFPHASFRFEEPPVGTDWWGNSLLGQLDEAQAEIDFLLAQVSEQIRMARFKAFVPSEDDTINEDHLADSTQGTIVRYDARAGKPHFETPPSVSAEALQHIDWLLAKLYESSGMSEQAASSQRPAGVNSGRGILFYHDFQTQRFIDVVGRFEQFVIDVVERLLDRAEELNATVEDDEGQPAGEEDDLSWSKVRMDREKFALGLESVSPVPRTYAGRMQRIEQLIAQGQIPPGYWAEYLKDPDAWRAEHRAAAQAEYVDWLLQRLENVEAEMPTVNDKMDLDLCLEVLTGEAVTLERKGADQEIRDRVDDFYDSVVQRRKELQALQAQQGPNPQAPQPVAPGLDKMATGGIGPTKA